MSDVSEPLRRLTDKDAIWCWQPPHDKAVETIKKLVTDNPVLRYYDTTEEVTIQCDASETGLGAVLLLKQLSITARYTLVATWRSQPIGLQARAFKLF